MSKTTKFLTLDVANNVNQPTIFAVEGDMNTRFISILLVDSGTPLVLHTGDIPVFRAIKPDGNSIYNNCEIEDGRVIVTLTDQCLAVSGIVNCDISVLDINENVLSTAGFNINVKKAPLGSPIASESELLELEHAIQGAETVDISSVREGDAVYVTTIDRAGGRNTEAVYDGQRGEDGSSVQAMKIENGHLYWSFKDDGTDWRDAGIVPTAEGQKIFVATYGQTTYSQMAEALLNHNTVLVFKDQRTYVYAGLYNNIYYFYSFGTGTSNIKFGIKLSIANGWEEVAQTTFEQISNRVNTISASSDNSHYPTAKAVYDFVMAHMG